MAQTDTHMHRQTDRYTDRHTHMMKTLPLPHTWEVIYDGDTDVIRQQ